MSRSRLGFVVSACLLACAALVATPALAQSPHHYSFGYDQPHATGYGIAGDIFNETLSKLSHGTMVIDQFPGAQLGQEPQMLQRYAPAILISSSPRPPIPRRSPRNPGCCRSITSSSPRPG